MTVTRTAVNRQGMVTKGHDFHKKNAACGPRCRRLKFLKPYLFALGFSFRCHSPNLSFVNSSFQIVTMLVVTGVVALFVIDFFGYYDILAWSSLAEAPEPA